MSTIQALVLENFMSHPNTEVTFSPGICLIAGGNRSGKTNLLRGLRWVLLNDGPPFNDDPALDALRFSGKTGKADFARARVIMDDGGWVERYRSKQRNEYTLHFPDGREERHTGPGAGFYPPVAQITGIFPVDIAGDTLLIGWQGVFDSKLLVGESPATTDKQLTHMIGVNVLETAARDAEADHRSLTAEAKSKAEEAEALKAQMQQFEDLPAAEAAVERVAEAWAKLTAGENAVAVASTAASTITSLGPHIQRLSSAIGSAIEATSRAASILTEAEAIGVAVNQATQAAEQHKVSDALERRGAEVLKTVADVVATANAIDYQERSICGQMEVAVSAYKVLGVAAAAGAEAEHRIEQYSQQLESLQEELAARLQEADVCPHCGRGRVCQYCGRETVIQ